jgi:hypothetical protein
MDHLLSTADAAELLGLAEWQARRLFEDGSLPEPPRFAGKRVVSRQLLRRIREAAIERGWIKDQAAARGPAIHPEDADRPNEKRGRPRKPNTAA